ncbi:hypothetical protein E2P86_13215 [Sphingobacterium psychroaquaticum]|uniref:hypothetical protein n=1 Tax=Sphingobacterium psychroaquaticum TaxID=561061 RepID=UPI00106CDB40|nr:hypothetical protein [Sphingobacterium psychroaquaticum]QBQ42055.1 hypothetical protein E2P86_13215 [Sphingobacterium psychroaquaticum]
MNIHIKLEWKSLLMLMLLFLVTGDVDAQQRMTKIKDGTVSGTSTEPFEGSVLELETNNKGFLAPRLTTAQRDAIPAARRTAGLLIYNTTTGCFNYWESNMGTWLSICGTPPPAVMTVDCAKVKLSGTLKQGQGIDASTYLEITVVVTQPGTYDVVASTDNGYYFSTTGSFPTAGTFTLYLPGAGTPQRGYNDGEPGDQLTIKIHGIETTCKPYVPVENANVNYIIDCNTAGGVDVQGSYMLGVPMNANNKIVLRVNVTSTGYWSIRTNTVNGYSFSGSGTFTDAGVQTIELLGTGTPIDADPQVDVFTLIDNSDTPSNCSDVQIPLLAIAYTMDCGGATVNGSYMHDVTLTTSNTITLPINVTQTGDTEITTTVTDGIVFRSGPLAIREVGPQNVILYGEGKPTKSGSTTLTLTGTPGGTTQGGGTCQVIVPIDAQPVNYTMSCSSIAVQGNYRPNVAMTSSNTMTLTVTPTYVGSWSITTDTQNGVIFKGSGTFATTGAQTVTLVAEGTPLTGGDFSFNLTSNSVAGNTTCVKSLTFVYRTMNILGLGGGTYQPGSAGTSQSSRSILASSTNFGPNGIVKVERMNIHNGAYGYGSTLQSNITNNNIDIIVIGYNYIPNSATIDILVDFVVNKKGALIFSQETSTSATASIINGISGGNVTVSGTGTTYYNPILGVNDPVLNGPFGDMRLKGTGSDVNNSYYVTNVPSNMTILATQQGNASRAHIIKHNTLGFMYVGDSGWTAGDVTNTSTTIWPAKVSSSGAPLSKGYDGGTVVYNSFVYANAVAWAIKYVQDNKPE